MKNIFKSINYYINILINKLQLKFYKKILNISEDGIVLLKVDRIGDFILWIKSLEAIINSYEEEKITIICERGVVQLLKNFKNLNIRIISVDRDKFLFNLYYRWKFLRKLKINKYKIVINPMYSRDFLSESLLEGIRAEKKIGIIGDDSNLNSKLLKKYNKNYTKLYTIPDTCVHELEINENFTDNICKNSINRISLDINFKKKRQIEEKYIVIFLGSSTPKKQWNLEKFIKIGQQLLEEYTLLLLGGRTEIKLGNNFQEFFKNKREVKNLIGCTTMEEVCNLIHNSELVITNDTFAVHLSTFLQKESVCIAGGGHFGRFLPYPQNSYKILPKVIYKKMKCFKCKWKCRYKTIPYKCIDLIEEKDVILKVRKILLEKEKGKCFK
ncbi:glycosyltransferase family 9 protein [Fusobacterium sp. HC1336]|uniref:glycosyltransferase family 9 protein n=1 Tax=Fusobacterium sp. HC1336 TaxID=3171169 RepID=UPI003F279BD3